MKFVLHLTHLELFSDIIMPQPVPFRQQVGGLSVYILTIRLIDAKFFHLSLSFTSF